MTTLNQPKNIQLFSILSSSEILIELQALAKTHPHLITLNSSQEVYQLPAAGNAKDCPFDREGTAPIASGCKNYFVTLQDTILHPPGSLSYRSLPEVFLSGALHGDERVGPTAVVHLARFIVEAADCEAKPMKRRGPASIWTDIEQKQFEIELQQRKQCIQDLYDKGVTDAQRKWLARLAATRRIVIVPTANALGYFRNERLELNIDANRDFPYDLLVQPGAAPKVSDQCMQTIAGRTINEIFRQHLFQISLTFHGGMEVIAYEWGAPTYEGTGKCVSPDDVAQKQIARGYCAFAGKFASTPDYYYGAMNPLVYSVRGGMEDWAYAASWDEDRAVQCIPTQSGGYNTSRTSYTRSMLRVVNMLIEASDYKTPLGGTLGTSENLLQPTVDEKANGHIARNIRLALMAVDLVQPYVAIQTISDNNVLVDVSDEIIPYDNRTNCKRDEERMVYIPSHLKSIDVQWTAGGGFTLDNTYILHTKWEDISNKFGCDPESLRHFKEDEMPPAFKQQGNFTNGRTRWHHDGPNPSTMDASFLGGPAFFSSVDLTTYSPGDKAALFAVARFDEAWSKHPDNSEPHGQPPTSHIVNARTDATWFHQVDDKILQGYVYWYSFPVTLILGRMDDDDKQETLTLLNSRFNDKSWGFNTTASTSDNTSGGLNTTEPSPIHRHGPKGPRGPLLVYFALIIMLCSVVVLVFLQRRSRYRRQLVSIDDYDDESDHEIPSVRANRRRNRTGEGEIL